MGGGDHLAVQKGLVELMTALRAKGLARTAGCQDMSDAMVRASIRVRLVSLPHVPCDAEAVTCV